MHASLFCVQCSGVALQQSSASCTLLPPSTLAAVSSALSGSVFSTPCTGVSGLACAVTALPVFHAQFTAASNPYPCSMRPALWCVRFAAASNPSPCSMRPALWCVRFAAASNPSPCSMRPALWCLRFAAASNPYPCSMRPALWCVRFTAASNPSPCSMRPALWCVRFTVASNPYPCSMRPALWCVRFTVASNPYPCSSSCPVFYFMQVPGLQTLAVLNPYACRVRPAFIVCVDHRCITLVRGAVCGWQHWQEQGRPSSCDTASLFVHSVICCAVAILLRHDIALCTLPFALCSSPVRQTRMRCCLWVAALAGAALASRHSTPHGTPRCACTSGMRGVTC